MNLHRSGKKPDWADVPDSRRNFWQQYAGRTKGVVTPGNALTVIGLLLTAKGLYDIWQGSIAAGAVWLAVGGLADIADGWLAERTGTKSPLGKSLDAAVDKLVLGATLVVLAAIGVVPLVSALIIGIHSLANVVLALRAQLLRRTIHVSPEGKYMMLLQRAAIGIYVIAAAVSANTTTGSGLAELGGALIIIGHLLTGLSLGIGIKATSTYARA